MLLISHNQSTICKNLNECIYNVKIIQEVKLLNNTRQWHLKECIDQELFFIEPSFLSLIFHMQKKKTNRLFNNTSGE